MNARDAKGNTALHGAADGGHVEVVAFLLAAKANATAKNAAGLTPVDVARARGHADVVQALAKR